MLNPTSRVFHDAVISLYEAGNSHITPNMVYSLLNGYKNARQVPEGFRKLFNENMRKMMYTLIKIDASEENKVFGIVSFSYSFHILPMIDTLANMNGETVECWKILEHPPFLAFFERTRCNKDKSADQLATGLNTAPENLVLTHYLLDQILTMRDDKSNHNNVILYDTVYAYLGVNAPNENAKKQEKMKVRKKVKAILDGWVKSGLIEG